MTDISREEALAHFGVKGQKWGVRNERRANAAKALVESKKRKMERGKEARAVRKPIKPKDLKNLTPEQKTVLQKRAVMGASIAVGAAAVAVILRKSGSTPVPAIYTWKPPAPMVTIDTKSAAEIFKEAYDSYVP